MPRHTAPHPRQEHRAGRQSHHTHASTYPPSRTPRIRAVDRAGAQAAALAAPTPEQRKMWQALAAGALYVQASTPQQTIALEPSTGRVFYAFGPEGSR